MDLNTPIKNAGHAFKLYAKRLEKLKIFKLEDFLYHIPFRYENYSIISLIHQLQPGEIVTVQGVIIEMKNEYHTKWKSLQKVKIQDSTGVIDALWFNQPYLAKTMHLNDVIAIAGKVEKNGNKLIFRSPEYELLQTQNFSQQDPIHTGRLVPVYPETKGVSSKWIRRQVYKIIHENKDLFQEYIPYSILEKNSLLEINSIFEHIHFPKNMRKSHQAKERLAFDELFLLHLGAQIRKQSWKKNVGEKKRFLIEENKSKQQTFLEQLSFTLTNAQKRVVDEICADFSSGEPMNRLLEGDVGSGKTIVATIAMYIAYLNCYQSTLMAPTEILAEQHFATINKLLSPFGVGVDLVTSSKKPAGIKKQESKITKKNSDSKNSFNILVGTHALLNKDVHFDKLGLIIIDEQQRFGVNQRGLLRTKGENPHLLTMTATPIPRTIALTLYGDLDLSVLDEMPKGRKTIKTWLVPSEKRDNAYAWVKKQIDETQSQVFIICPFIEQSESMTTVKAATKEFDHLTKNVFPKLKLGLLHGKMKAKEKDTILKKFGERKIDILIATPVVEVGIDFPNATIIVIEAAERFGLAQLHQLRGRVGRGDKQSYCLLFTESNSPQTRSRLKSLETMHIGAELAELDLKLRGAGDIYGTMQHGIQMLKFASFSDLALIEKTKREAEKIFPELHKYPKLLEKVKHVEKENISPD